MTSYNERLDEILSKLARNATLAYKTAEIATTPSAANDASKRYEWSIVDAKQALISLIRELVAEAKIDELKHLVYDDGVWYEDMTRQFPQKITFNQRIKELEAWTN